MFKTLRSKLLFGTIISVVVINIIFTIFIALFLENTLRTDIINEITNIKKFSINTINQNELIGESKWKSLNSIKGLTNSYVSMINDKGETNEYISVAISEDEINNIVNESKNFKSIIRFILLLLPVWLPDIRKMHLRFLLRLPYGKHAHNPAFPSSLS